MRGFYSIGIWQSKCEANLGTLWRTAHIFGASYVFTVGRRYKHQPSDTLKTPRHIPLLYYIDNHDLIDHLPYGCPLIGVELDERAQSLTSFRHPQQACYLLGAEDNGLSDATMNICHGIIRIPGDRSLNVAVAGSIVLYDRISKVLPRPLTLQGIKENK